MEEESVEDLRSEQTDKKQEDQPEYLKEVGNVRFLNISLKGYEKKTGSSGFTKEEYYAYRIVSMYVICKK